MLSKSSEAQKGLIFLFLDGVGIGTDDVNTNPFVSAKTPCLDSLSGSFHTSDFRPEQTDKKLVQTIDANLGVDGLPQSATGQATIVTGKNASEVLGRHMGPWPGPTLHKLLDEGSLFSELRQAGKTVALANAYPQGYFDALEHKKPRLKNRLSSLTYALDKAKVRKRTFDDYSQGDALAADITGAYFSDYSNGLVYDAFEAGECFVKIASEADLCVFDFWLSDRAGHRFEFEDCIKLIEELDRFIAGIISQIDKVNTYSLVITSDHGNLEDKSTKGHTRNPVPFIVYGADLRGNDLPTSLIDVRKMFSTLLKLNS